MKSLLNAVSSNLISGDAYILIIKGILITAGITIIAWIVSTLIGMGLGYFMSYEKKIVSRIAECLSFLLRSVPVLLVALLFYYACYNDGALPVIWLGAAIGLWGGGQMAELIFNAVKSEQTFFTERLKDKLERVFFSTVVWQAIEDAAFPIKRLAIHILQWSTIAGYVAVNDLTEVMTSIGKRTMYPFFSVFFCIICYLATTVVIELVYSIIMKHIKK